eukprot:CAMPEP_0171541008 /NCGR_PEP_ID=MMETSP0960-20121227/1521_1 /TAXON_ID=87120 /ORGANISM="Aurantiochytrium limacinum, Strain ATCCMYA-1381" /LENGTH=752 /DNA_ID=CAMNT_0012088287 /DNA_START=323 /DNA_END=2581 /DNA_ORIENTATION=+
MPSPRRRESRHQEDDNARTSTSQSLPHVATREGWGGVAFAAPRNQIASPSVSKDNNFQKRFIAWTDLHERAKREDKIDFAVRELRFHLFFFLIIVPFFILQGHMIARFQTLEYLRNAIERRSFWTGFPVNTTSQMPPPFWYPLLDSEVASTLKGIRFGQVSDETEYWDWVTQIVGQGIMFPQFIQNGITQTSEEAFWYFGNDTLAEEIRQNYNYKAKSALKTDMILLGGARLRAVRVVPFTPTPGSAAAAFQNLNRYPPFSNEVEATSLERYGFFSSTLLGETTAASSNETLLPQTYYPNLETYAYFWEQSEVLSTEPIKGEIATYPGNGFAISLPLATSSWYSTANRLAVYRTGVFNLTRNGPVRSAESTDQLLDTATRAVILSMTFYNANTNLYSYVECVLESGAEGTFNTFVNYYIAPQPGKGSSSQTLQGEALAEVCFASLSFVYMVLCFLRFLRNLNWYRNGSPWVIVELITMALYGIALAWIVDAYYISDPLKESNPTLFEIQASDPFWVCIGNSTSLTSTFSKLYRFRPCGGQPPITESIGLWAKDYVRIQTVFAVLFLLGCLKLMRYMLQFWRFKLFTETLYVLRWDLLYLLFFVVIFSVMYVGYSLAGYLFYQAGSARFRTIAWSMMTTLLNLVRIDTSYYMLVHANVYASMFTPVFYFTFFFIFIWTFASVLLAMIYHAWYRVKDSAYAVELESWRTRALQRDLDVLFSVGDQVEHKSHPKQRETSVRSALQKAFHRNPDEQ